MEYPKTKKSRFKDGSTFFQNTLYIDSDIVVTPKPIHHNDKVEMWCYSKPVGFYEEIVKKIGEFDLKSYWGPFASIKSSKWIMDAALYTIKIHHPDLMLVYLPHLDYAGLKYGPESIEFQKSIMELDSLVGELVSFLDSEKLDDEYEIMIVSEYSFEKVNKSISPNVILRDEGLLKTRHIEGKDYLDYENSKAFAMVDHQIAHVFVKPGLEDAVTRIFKKHDDSVSEILDKNAQKNQNILHRRSGDLILTAQDSSWFNYYWWKEKERAPDFAFKVDIHRKPGFDPLELFIDASSKTISQDVSLIKGSHGLVKTKDENNLPICGLSILSNETPDLIDVTQIAPTISDILGYNDGFPRKPF